MLVHSAKLYLASAGTSVSDHTYKLLEIALSTAAYTGATEQYQELLEAIEGFEPGVQRDLLNELDRMADRFVSSLPDGGDYQAVLLSVPVMIITDQPVTDLDEAALRTMTSSLRRHGLIHESVSAVLLPWLTQTPARIENPIFRHQLLQELARPMSLGPFEADDAYLFQDIAKTCRPPEPPSMPGVERTTVRYLTMVLSAPGTLVPELVDRLWHEVAIKARVDAWLTDVGLLITDFGKHKAVQPSLPMFAADAEAEGHLQLSLAATVAFINGSANAPGAKPASECRLTIKPERHDGAKTHVRLRYSHEGETMGVLKIELASPRRPEDIGLVSHALGLAASESARNAGVGQVEFLDL